MAGKAVPNMKGVRVFPPAPKGFDALAAMEPIRWFSAREDEK